MTGSTIGAVVPCYCNEEWEVNFPRFLKSLEHISEINNIQFLYNFQGFDKDRELEIIKMIEDSLTYNSTWSHKYVFNSYYPQPVSMVKIRNDVMMLNPNHTYYIYLDDDIKFNPGSTQKVWRLAIDLLDGNDDVGLIMMAGYLGGSYWVNKLKVSTDKFWMTNKGLFLRNLYKEYSPIYDKYILDNHIGGLEEMIASYMISAEGLKCGTLFNNNTIHKCAKVTLGNEFTDEHDDIHNPHLAYDNMEDIIRNHYDDKSYDISTYSRILRYNRVLYNKALKSKEVEE